MKLTSPIAIKANIIYQSNNYTDFPEQIEFTINLVLITAIEKALELVEAQEFIQSIAVNTYGLNHFYPDRSTDELLYKFEATEILISEYSVVVSLFEKFNGFHAQYDISQLLQNIHKYSRTEHDQ